MADYIRPGGEGILGVLYSKFNPFNLNVQIPQWDREAVLAYWYQTNLLGGSPTTPPAIRVTGSSPSVISTVATATAPLVAALAERIGGQVPTQTTLANLLPTAVQPAMFQDSRANGGCSCQPRPGRCEPQYIDRDFGAFGADPCSADPRYPRPSTHNGQEVCAPARRKPRMNPMNARAAGRAARRLAGAARAFKRIKKATAKAARMY